MVTGASSGIGAALAKLLARQGYDLILTARREAELNGLACELKSAGAETVDVIAQDLEPAGAAASLIGEVERRGLAPDLLINNAGYGLVGPAAELEPSAQRAMINLNVTALTDLSVHYAGLMGDRGQGGIINIASVASTLPGPNMAVYYATKAYILNFTEALAHELGPKGVTVTVVLPGVTKTGFHARAGMEQSLLMRLSRPMSPDAVARMALEGFRKKRRIVVPGLFNKFAVLCTRFVPKFILLPVTGRLHSN